MREQNINVFLFLKTVLMIYPGLLGSQHARMGHSLSYRTTCLAIGVSSGVHVRAAGEREAHVLPYTLQNPLCPSVCPPQAQSLSIQ